MAVAGSVNPAAASAALPDDGAVASCASPPDKPDAAAANRNRFVDLWSTRFADSAWLKGFTDRARVPADILAEGCHDLDPQTQLWLNS